ncbi:hypothetical protein GCM10011514_48030 [Emticicia aquatilis]|uniref:DUF2846 domain-containing protein n=1 Tax=Emticicia aquatilis TaxID=1537369 RepID=A0A916Z611_9BACT|nr:hypothetical protein [Emticicia aquatilis]GGD78387.1 hypothetical protein GCM10011514_48030 [Emticicia aquatilis]
MKTAVIFFLSFIFSIGVFAQITNENSMSVMLDGKEFKTQPRQIKIGNYAYFTGNATKPDKMLRIWLGDYYGRSAVESGNYLIVNADNPDTKENIKKAQDLGKYKGIAAIKYVEEIKEPRMDYHVGESQNNDETLEVKAGADGFIEITFNATLIGSYWKEKASATVLGGLGRIKDKIESKVITSATGFDSDIDPEGNGYKKQDKKDTIVLKDGKMKLKKN